MPRVGSALNHIAGQSIQSFAEPKVGDGVTICHWTDRTVGTVDQILTPSSFIFREDRVEYNYPGGNAKSIERDPEGRVGTAKRVRSGRDKGQWRFEGKVVMVGVRDPFYDYQF